MKIKNDLNPDIYTTQELCLNINLRVLSNVDSPAKHSPTESCILLAPHTLITSRHISQLKSNSLSANVNPAAPH